VKLGVSAIIVLALLALPVLQMPSACCYRMAASATHPCCPATSSRIPSPRAATRALAAPLTIEPRTRVIVEAPAECAPCEHSPASLSTLPLTTIQLRI
jgi:hypothetical protein